MIGIRLIIGLLLVMCQLSACIEVGVVGSQSPPPSIPEPEKDAGEVVPSDTPDGGDPGDADVTACGATANCIPCLDARTCPSALPYCNDGRCVACTEDLQCAPLHCEDGQCEAEEEDETESDSESE